MRQALSTLMEVAPLRVDVQPQRRELADVLRLEEVCDLRIWTLTSGMEAATVHVIVDDGDVDGHGILDQTRHTLPEQGGVTHPTIHVEPDEHIEDPAGF